MPQAEIRVEPANLHNEKLHRQKVANKLRVPVDKLGRINLIRRSIDARKETLFVLRYETVKEIPQHPTIADFNYQNVAGKPEVTITGFGPAGMFAALKLIELGLKPVIIERGKRVRERRRDLAILNRQGFVNPESNYCFGEGGAGTFSDGKLYTRSKKRGDVNRVLEILVAHGASPDILIDAHPHIGTNRLPKIIESMRQTILDFGGEILFDHKLVDIEVDDEGVKGIIFNDGSKRETKTLILATGHSARDIFELFPKKGWAIEAKPFAIGVRVEHPQSIIDSLQYHCEKRHENLPAASYSWVHQELGRGVYSFCMCPGGIICPSATAVGEIVVNGWSPSKRNSPFANSGIVVEVRPEDFKDFEDHGPLAGMYFQANIEKEMNRAGGGKQVAPAQRLTDFVHGRESKAEPQTKDENGELVISEFKTSYLPGVKAAPLHEILPTEIVKRLQAAFRDQERKMKGYLSDQAIVVGVESRTSSPVKIPRDEVSLMHPEVKGLYPCGEGAGYAGGIMSAALDGEKCANASAVSIQSQLGS